MGACRAIRVVGPVVRIEGRGQRCHLAVLHAANVCGRSTSVIFMRIRATLRSPLGDSVTRDIVGGRWAEPSGDADEHLGQDEWALPGLVDAHAHLAAEDLAQPGDLDGAIERSRIALEAGLMLILDKGWNDTTTLQLMDKVPVQERPDIEAAAHIISVEGGYFPHFAREIDPAAVKRAVDEEARLGSGWVKLIGDWPRKGRGPVANFTESQMRAAVETAGRAGAKVAIHTMAPDVPTAAVAAGVHSIEHGMFLTEDDLESLGGRGGMWVPTVLRVEATIGQLGESSSGGRLLKEGLDNVRRLMPGAIEAGVHVLAGTDLVGSPAAVAREAMKLASYGMSNPQAVDAVTGSALTATGRPADFPIGATANAVLFDENPTVDLAVLTSPAHVIRHGALW